MNLKSLLYPHKWRYYRLIWFKHDLPAGLTVFLVALPLCLGISLASGAPLYSGILSGVVGGIVVSLISGSQLGVSGPAAGLTTVVAASIIGFGDYRVFLLAVFFAGLLQLILGILKLGTVALYFPSAVIKGMLAAIGIILISKQIPLSLGYDQPDFWTEGFLGLFSSNQFYKNIGNFYHHFSMPVVLVTLVSLAILAMFNDFFRRRAKWLPLPLLVVLVGVGMSALMPLVIPSWALKASQIVSIPANIFGEITTADFSKTMSDTRIFTDAFTIALLASLETLLCVEAIDKLDPLKRKTPVNRELIAQGAGNMICGLVGAIPMTAVIVRGAANVDAGARTRLSAFTHGVFLLLAVVAVPFALSMIPFASLAAILLITGYNLTKPALYRQMFRLGWNQFLPFAITIIVILATDLLEGVAIGLLISIYFLVRNNFKAEYKIERHRESATEHYYIKLNSMVTFLNKVNLQNTLYKAPPYSVLTIDGSDSRFIDYDVLEMISEFEKQAHEKHIQLILKNVERVNVTALH
ncbi:MAG: SulP family inorganic anion transporter [Haliscomenobacteraceae bacterium CHB4]|nr:SulP family inorganic anion transporter [Haliscomenobacteraceae bacterium CHB4]